MNRKMPSFKPEDLVAIMSAGAYGFSMASNYNSRPRPIEVMVKGKRFSIVRARETYDDLISGEVIPGFIDENND
jgi:diaminopimelate decarboxylase